ncbi:MAG: hypothetical protein Q4G10_00570 [Bacteroidia bacterium]|nr:hypothetical protein [Bacteroidia bacterium]
MKRTGYFISYIIMLFLQICICNFFRLSPYVVLSILPVMILLIPTGKDTTFALIVAFLTGLSVDLLGDGLLGLNILALVPVAFARKGIIRLVFGEEIFTRKENITVNKQGFWKISVALIMAQSLFLAIYVWADGAGTRPLWFSFVRFGASLLAGFLISLFVADILTRENSRIPDNRLWK